MTETIATDQPFTAAEQNLLRVLAGMIIPASEQFGLPGADQAPIFDDILASAVAQTDEIKAALTFAGNLEGELSDQIATLQRSVVFAPVVVLVMQCYYRADDVLTSLGMEARAPYPKGFEIEQGDWSLLEPVVERGKIWRDA